MKDIPYSKLDPYKLLAAIRYNINYSSVSSKQRLEAKNNLLNWLYTPPPLISRERAESTVPYIDCGGRKYNEAEREDIIRYVLEGAEIQRDFTHYKGSCYLA